MCSDISDVVWAKLRYCAFWPARVVPAPSNLKAPRDKKCVLFFGSKTFGFVDGENIKDYLQNRQKYADPRRKGKAFVDAVNKCDDYIKDPVKFQLHGNVKPERTIVVKEEFPVQIKQEADANVSDALVDVANQQVTNDLQELQQQIVRLNREKDGIIEQLIAAKSESQRMFLIQKKNEDALRQRTQGVLNLQRQLDETTGEFNRLQATNGKTKAALHSRIAILENEIKEHKNEISRLVGEKSALIESINGSSSTTDTGDDEYEVKEIIKHKAVNKKRLFFIRWKGFTSEHDSWEPEKNLQHLKIYKKYINNNFK